MTDILGTIGTILGTINTINGIVERDEQPAQTTAPVVVEKAVPSEYHPQPAINLNLTINVYKDGKLVSSGENGSDGNRVVLDLE